MPTLRLPIGAIKAADHPALREIGWTPQRAASFKASAREGLEPARLVSSGPIPQALTASGHVEVVQRRWLRTDGAPEGGPAVGDWLAIEQLTAEPGRAVLRDVLPRHGTFVRQRSAAGGPQVLAANLDLAFLVSGLDHDLKPRRIERYLLLAVEGGVTPVVILNKVDVALDVPRAVAEVHAVAAGVRVIVCSALTGAGVDELRSHLQPGLTACFLGSSGVGKSSLTNALLGEQRQDVRALREDDSRGRHTTTRRQLFVVPGGGLVIDTPGLRAVGVLGDASSLATSFDDVAALARRCRFSDCGHDAEPGCAVRAAVEAGTLPAARLASHRKLEAELRSVALRSDVRQARAAGRRLGRLYRHHGKMAERAKRGEG